MTAVSDDFTRPDESPMAGNWTQIAPVTESFLDLFSDHVIAHLGSADGETVWNADTFVADQSSKATLSCVGTTGSGSGVGLLVRSDAVVGTRSNYRFVADHAATNNVRISRRDVGVTTVLVTFTQAWTDGDVWEFTAIGDPSSTVLTLYLNGSQVQQLTDTAGLAGGAPGLAFSSIETSIVIDDWFGVDFPPVPPPPSGLVGQYVTKLGGRGAGW